MSTVSILRKPQVLPATRESLNALWLRLDQARSVADCISVKCEVSSENEEVSRAIAQINGLAGAVSTILGIALAEINDMEAGT